MSPQGRDPQPGDVLGYCRHIQDAATNADELEWRCLHLLSQDGQHGFIFICSACRDTADRAPSREHSIRFVESSVVRLVAMTEAIVVHARALLAVAGPYEPTLPDA